MHQRNTTKVLAVSHPVWAYYIQMLKEQCDHLVPRLSLELRTVPGVEKEKNTHTRMEK